MTDNVRQRLVEWVGKVDQTASVSFAPPADGQPGSGASLYLLELSPFVPAAETRRRPLQLTLRYLVTTWSGEQQDAERLLLDLAFAAMEHPEYEAEFAPLPVSVWSAFAVTPRPSFILRVPARRTRPAPPVPRVRMPLVMQATPAVPLYGVVLGPGDFPIAGAYVQIPVMQLSTHTDAQGRFRFAALPVEPRARHLRVTAKGVTHDVTVDPPESAGEPVVIHFELGEE